MTEFILFADESHTHQTPPLRRYWCFYGALAGYRSNIAKFHNDMKDLRRDEQFNGSIAWKNINADNINFGAVLDN